MFKRHESVFLLTLVAPTLTVYAQDPYFYRESYGTGVPTDGDDYTRNLVKNANENPNATRSVNFRPFAGIAGSEDLDNLRDAEWTWRVNVTDFAAPNAAHISGVDFVNPHVVNTVYDFEWPGDGNISSALKSSAQTFCASNLAILGSPANVSNAYTDENTGSADCAPVLGDSCVDAITGSVSSSAGDLGCVSVVKSWFSLPECAGTLGFAYDQDPKHLATINTYNINGLNGLGSLLSGQAFWVAMSDVTNGTNTTTYEAAVNQLQVMMISTVIDGRKPEPQLLCMRVNTTQLLEAGVGGDDGSMDDTNAGNLLAYPSKAWIALSVGWILFSVAYAP